MVEIKNWLEWVILGLVIFTLGSSAYQSMVAVDLVFAPPWLIIVAWINANAGIERTVGTIVVGLLTLMSIYRFWLRPHGDHGSARWATEREIKKAGLRSTQGLVLGLKDGQMLVSNGPDHVAMFGTTRAEKGVSIVVPNILSWPGSLVVNDPKGENWAITSSHLKSKGVEVYLFDPVDDQTHRFNPLDLVNRAADEQINDLQKIATLLYTTPEKGDPMWANISREYFIGLGLLLLNNHDDLGTDNFGVRCGSVTFGDILRLGATKENPKSVIAALLEADENRLLPPECHRLLGVSIDTTDKTFTSMLATFRSGLSLWSNPKIDRATSCSDFDIGSLREQRQAVFVASRIGDMDRLKPLLTLFFELVNTELTRDIQASGPFRVLMLMDEMRALGRMESISTALPLVAGYGVHYLCIFQSISQIAEKYGTQDAADSMLENFMHKIFARPNHAKTAQVLSQMIGKQTIKVQSGSRRLEGGGSSSRSMTGRDLVQPSELLKLDKNTLIIITQGIPPIKANKARYYDHKLYQGAWHHWEYNPDQNRPQKPQSVAIRQDPSTADPAAIEELFE